MRLIKDYMKDPDLRALLNALTREVFGFDFESWETAGYDQGNYIPYSYEEGGRLIANASANRMEFVQNGKKRSYLQLGTVMTRKDFRNRGCAKSLIETILREREESCDGVYLFADLGAVELYRKLGFSPAVQYRYSMKSEVIDELRSLPREEGCFQRVDSPKTGLLADYQSMILRSAAYSDFYQTNAYGLQMFYTAGLKQVFYSEALKAFAVAEQKNGILFLKSLICEEKLRIKQAVRFWNSDCRELVLGFTPCREEVPLFDVKRYDGGEDYRLLIRGEALREIEKEKLYFPELSHA